jgi:hypothetical protein
LFDTFYTSSNEVITTIFNGVIQMVGAETSTITNSQVENAAYIIALLERTLTVNKKGKP